VRHLYDNNLYFFAEAMWQDLGSKTNRVMPFCSDDADSAISQVKTEPTNLTGVIGVGWQF
jgi:hypothetical protein